MRQWMRQLYWPPDSQSRGPMARMEAEAHPAVDRQQYRCCATWLSALLSGRCDYQCDYQYDDSDNGDGSQR